MTARGEGAYRAASERQARWAETLATDLSPERIEAAADLLREIGRRLGTTTTTVAMNVEEI